MEEGDREVITTLQVDGLAQLFGSEELESRTTPFQEGEDDEDMSPVTQVSYIEGPITRSRAKLLQKEVN